MSIKGKVFTGKMSVEDLAEQERSLRDEYFYATLAKIGSGHVALQTTQKKFAMKGEGLAVEAGSTENIVNLSNHGFKEGYLVRFMSTTNDIGVEEAFVYKVIDADNFQLSANLEAPLVAGDLIDVLNPVYERVAPDGSAMATVTSGPIRIIKNGAAVEVSDDTDPADVVSMPVKIMAVDGTNITMNNNTITMYVTAEGVNYSSLRIGDGSGRYAEITVDNEILTSDAKLLALLDSFKTNPLNPTLRVSDGDTVVAIGVLATKLDSVVGELKASNILLTGIEAKDFATSAKQDLQTAELTTISGKDFATSAKQDLQTTALGSINTSINTVATNTNGVAKDATVLLTNTELSQLNTTVGTTAVTPAAADNSDAPLMAFIKRLAGLITAMSSKLPVTLGQKLSGESLSVVMASDAVVKTVSTPATDGAQDKGVMAANAPAITLSAPVGAKACMIRNMGVSEGTLHWEIGGTANANSFDLIPLTSTPMMDSAADISLYATDGSVRYVVQWFI